MNILAIEESLTREILTLLRALGVVNIHDSVAFLSSLQPLFWLEPSVQS
jgi:hypothetical protein